MRTAPFSASTAKRTSRTTTIIRKNFILRPATAVSVFLKRVTPASVSASAGISGSPETARCLALAGADLILYPTAIGSEPILEVDSVGHWQRAMQGHAAANILPVAAANRYGVETVVPCAETAGSRARCAFYGSSFLTDETGRAADPGGKERGRCADSGL